MRLKKENMGSIRFMVIITALFTFLLAFIYGISTEKIQQNQGTKLQKKVLYAFQIPYDEYMSVTEIQQIYETHIRVMEVGEKKIYEAYGEDGLIGYGKIIEGPGLWGNIHGFIAVGADGKSILGISFISHSETPGLGGRIDEAFFQEQFRHIEMRESYPYISYRPATDGLVDAISGATLTSKSVLDLINKGIEKLREDLKRGNR